jgi:signal transduction histidine kinase
VSRRILLAFLGLVVVVLAALEVPLGVQNARTEQRTLSTKLERDATTLASLSEDSLKPSGRALLRPLAAFVYRYAQDTGGRVVIVDARALAVLDTNASRTGTETFASRPEIKAALAGSVASGTRRSATLRARLLYVAVPVLSAGKVVGAVRITYPTSAVDSRVRRYWLVLAAIAAIVLLVAAAVGMRVAAFVARPLRGLERTAAAVGGGELSTRAAEDAGPPEVRSLAAVFNDTVAKLEHLLSSQQEFVADASHQLRTPLTALRLRLENLARDVAEPGQADLAGALAEVERLAGLVDGLLSLARADSAASPAGRVDVGAVLHNRIDAWASLAEERDVRLLADVGAARPAAASEERLRQVLDNLIENALEASPAGGTVTLSARSAPPWVEIRVRDEGPGMSDDERRRAFDRFWRARAGEGSGLGLAIVRRLVEADGGTVELAPASGRGLEAVIRLRPA